MTRTQRAREALRKAEETLAAAVIADYPLGKRTGYLHGKNWIPCIVVDHAGDRVKIRSGRSGKVFWVGSYSLSGGSSLG